MSKTKRKHYMPGIEGGYFHHNNPDGPDVEIGPEGIVTTDPDKIELLDNSNVKGHRNGFYEVPIEPLPEEDESKDIESFEDVPDDAEFPFNYGASYYFLSNGEKVQGKDNAVQAQKELEMSKEEPEGDLSKITTINEAKEYLATIDSVEESDLTSKEAILDTADTVGVEFPMLK